MIATITATVALSDSGSVDARSLDWRMGPVIYQVFIDRFAPPASLESKRKWILPPRTLKAWSDLPKAGHVDDKLGCWTHELEFWGGDLASLTGKLDYIQSLGADVLNLTPIHQAFTNHRYDAQNYSKVAPELGTRKDVKFLAQNLHRRNMKLMLDGVFNHMGRTSPMFQEALSNPNSKHRDWYYIGKEFKGGYRGWAGASNLPGLRLENKHVRNYLWNNKDSIVKSYLADGIDGWRLDVGFELGPKYLKELTDAAHTAKPGSAVVGEISGYPSDWFPAVDGVFNFLPYALTKAMFRGEMTGGQVGRSLNDMVSDAGIENLLRSWIHLDNHDTPRLASDLPDLADRKIAVALQLTLPGSPVIYYGSELGMKGTGDPANRAPMRWDLVTDSNPDLTWMRKLLGIRKSHPALHYGNFIALQTNQLLAYIRTTGKVRNNVMVVANPTQTTLTEVFPARIGRLQSWGELKDLLSSERIRCITGMVTVTVPARTVRIFVPVDKKVNGYSPLNRIK